MSKNETKEPQNQSQYDTYQTRGPVQLGPWTSHIWRTDPRHLAFLLARYKFCGRMLEGKEKVLEVGCGDAFGTPIVLQSVESVYCVDFEPLIIDDARERMQREDCAIAFAVHDMTNGAVDGGPFDGAYSLDVIEHIPPEQEHLFVQNVCDSLREDAVFIVGTPNIHASRHASEYSRAGHVNLKSAVTLRELLQRYFRNSVVFSMNDELVHTGFYPMAHYIIGMGVGKADRGDS